MEKDLTPISKAEQALAHIETPAQGKNVEAMAAAAKAWAKEQGDYEKVIEASKIYILAKRKTTELIEPEIVHGDHGLQKYRGDNVVTSVLADYGFTKMQWSRRKKELEISPDDIDSYFDDCIEKHAEPTTFGLLRFVFQDMPHVFFNSGENEWYTPIEYIEAARTTMGRIDLDPASSDLANKTVKAAKIYTIEDDGLSQFWAGKVWMNPPYSSELIGKFTAKFSEHVLNGDIKEGIVLVNNATETNWFHSLLENSSELCLVKGRIKFIDKNGNPSGAPLQGQVIVYFGKNTEKFCDNFRGFGKICKLEE